MKSILYIDSRLISITYAIYEILCTNNIETTLILQLDTTQKN